MKLTKHCLFVYLLLIQPLLVLAQKETNNWFFGINAGLTFNGASPQYVSVGKVNTIECSASVSDTSGNLLFYTDGTNVWDKNHQQMPNGYGLSQDPFQYSVTQGALIVKQPLSNHIYYLFNLGQCVTALNYAIVDMSMNGGLGDVVSKNNVAYPQGNYFEKLVAIKHCNNRDVWIIILGRDSTTLIPGNEGIGLASDDTKPVSLYCFLLTPYGVSNYPVVTNLGNLKTAICFGQMKAASTGNRIAFGNVKGYTLMDFNKEKGEAKNVKEVNFPIESGYGMEFSPNGKFLYFNNNQIEVEAGNSIKIAKPVLSQFQLASDNKIYFILNDTISTPFEDDGNLSKYNKNLGAINNPDSIGLTGKVTYYYNLLDLNRAIYGLPNFPSYYFYHPLGEFSYQFDCVNNTTTFKLVNSPVIDSVRWIFHDDASTSNSYNPTHTYNAPGNYGVDVLTFKNGETDTVKQCVTILGSYTDFLGEDITICADESKMIGVTTPHIGKYKWSTGDTTAGIVVNETGDYTLQITNNCATYSDVIHVEKVFCEPEIRIPNVFTPNADGINDVFSINAKNIKSVTCNIYNRWGIKIAERVYDNLAINSQILPLWDGKIKSGIDCSEGTYYYIIQYNSYQNKFYQSNGFVTLLK